MLKNSPIFAKLDLRSTRANFVWAMALQSLEKAAGYVALAVFTRTIDKEQLGLMFFAATISGLCATLLTFGTDTHLVRSVASDPDSGLQNFSRVLSTRIVNAVLVYAALNLSFALFDPSLVPVLMLVTAFDFLEELYYCFSQFFTGQKNLFLRLLVSGAFEILTMAAVSLAAIVTRSLFPVLITYVVMDVAALIAVSAVVRRYFGAFHLSWSRQEIVGLLQVSWPFFLLNFLTLVLMRFDTVLVGIMLDFKQVANYELGIKLLEVTRFLVRPLVSVFFPVFTEYVVRAEWAHIRLRFWQLTLAVTGLGLLLFAGMAALGSVLITWMFGSSYADSVAPARILFLSVPPLYICFVATIVANALHLEKQSVVALVICVAANVGLDMFLIPALGIQGAAWGSVASQVLLAVIMVPMIVLRLRQNMSSISPVPQAGQAA